MRLLVGLGNPGREYENNRHNVGFMAIDEIAAHYRLSAWRSRFESATADGTVGDRRVLAMKPMTYMNRSGRAVGAAVRFFKLDPAAVFVFQDEMDLAPGKVRVKKGGGAGGHNGIRDIASHIGQDFWRIRIGVGHPGSKERVIGHVLKDFAKADQGWRDQVLDSMAGALDLLLDGDEGRFMNKVSVAVQALDPKADKKSS